MLSKILALPALTQYVRDCIKNFGKQLGGVLRCGFDADRAGFAAQTAYHVDHFIGRDMKGFSVFDERSTNERAIWPERKCG